MAKTGNWNSISGFLTNFLHCGLRTNHRSLSRDAKWRGWPGWFHRSLLAWEVISLNITSDLTFTAEDRNSFPFGPWLLLFFCSWHRLCTHGSRFRMCSQTMSGSCRRHPGILFIKLGSSIVANTQWLESWELDTLESLSTFETGTHSLSWTERRFQLQNNPRFT